MSMFSGGVNAVDRVSTASTSGLTYTVWADFGGRYLWIKEPGDMSRGPGRSWGRPHRVPTALTYELEAWQAKLERATTIYQAEPEGGWDAFDRVGRELAGRLKRELGTDVAVWYVDRAPASHGAGAYEM